MKKHLILGVLILLGVFFGIPTLQAVNAASLKFDKTTVTVGSGQTFDLAVQVDAGSEQITSIDAYVLFPGSALEAQSVTDGTFFPAVSHNIQSGKVYVAGLVEDLATSRTGTGTVATIRFRALTGAGGQITYDCREGAADSSKIIKNDINATNIIVCSENGATTVSSSGDGGTVSPTPTICPACQGTIVPSPTRTPTRAATPTTCPTCQGGGNGGTGGGGTNPTQLPQSGIMDNMVNFSLAGGGFLLIGIVLRLLVLKF